MELYVTLFCIFQVSCKCVILSQFKNLNREKNVLYVNLVSKSVSWAPQMKPCLLWYHSFQANRFLFGTYQVAQMVMNLPAMQEIPVQSWVEQMPGDGNGSLLQYSYLESPADRGAWRTTVPGVWDSVAAAREYASNGAGRNMSGSFQDLGLPRELRWEPLKFKQGFLVPLNWIWKDE